MRVTTARLAMLVLAAVAALLPAAAAAKPDRPVFDLKGLNGRQYQIESRSDLQGIGEGLQVIVMRRATPEGEEKGLTHINRLFVLAGDRVVFDSFEFDEVGEAVEPGINTRTFFRIKWSVLKRGKNAGLLVLTGLVPLQDPGEPLRLGNRTLVLALQGDGGFDDVVDATSAKPAAVGGTDVRIPL